LRSAPSSARESFDAFESRQAAPSVGVAAGAQ
jgi:hypothetical protein